MTWLDAATFLAFVYFIVLNTSQIVTAAFSIAALRRHAARSRLMRVIDDYAMRGEAPGITLLVPAYNEEPTCVEAVQSLLTLEYGNYEILVINDGSKDDTLGELARAFNLVPAQRFPLADLPTTAVRAVFRSARHPHLWVLDKTNGGKADALNAGLNRCRTPLFCAIDADCVLERDALKRIVRPFIENNSTVAAGGLVRIANGCEFKGGALTDVRLPDRWLARFQVLEYLRAFLTGRMGWDAMSALLIISGAFGLFRRSAVIDAGGFARDTVGEDMELIVRLHRYCRENRRPYRITFLPDPVAWTECPEKLSGLARQRDRWQRGLVDSLLRHARMLGNPRYGPPGLIAFPYYFFIEALGPIVELFGYVFFLAALIGGRASPAQVAAFAFLGFGHDGGTIFPSVPTDPGLRSPLPFGLPRKFRLSSARLVLAVARPFDILVSGEGVGGHETGGRPPSPRQNRGGLDPPIGIPFGSPRAGRLLAVFQQLRTSKLRPPPQRLVHHDVDPGTQSPSGQLDGGGVAVPPLRAHGPGGRRGGLPRALAASLRQRALPIGGQGGGGAPRRRARRTISVVWQAMGGILPVPPHGF